MQKYLQGSDIIILVPDENAVFVMSDGLNKITSDHVYDDDEEYYVRFMPDETKDWIPRCIQLPNHFRW